jgi:tRNA(Ile2) C34 agmatinyltransferase TiaS
MYIVRSLSMANWLCQNGHKILKVEDSEKDSRFKVFFFKDTAELHKTMKHFYKGV